MESGILWDPCYKEACLRCIVREKSVLAFRVTLHKAITICVTSHLGTDTCVGNTCENGTENRKTFNCENTV